MKTVISCVVDAHPKFLMEAWNLVLTLAETGDFSAPDTEFTLHHTGAVSVGGPADRKDRRRGTGKPASLKICDISAK